MATRHLVFAVKRDRVAGRNRDFRGIEPTVSNLDRGVVGKRLEREESLAKDE
jgi:hypothetical protein